MAGKITYFEAILSYQNGVKQNLAKIIRRTVVSCFMSLSVVIKIN